MASTVFVVATTKTVDVAVAIRRSQPRDGAAALLKRGAAVN